MSIKLENVYYTYSPGTAYEIHALENVNLTIPDGQFIGMIGHTGSGKSTLLHMLGGLDRPTSGKVFVDGKDIFSLKDEALTIFRRRKIGFVFQSYNLVPVLNVYENIVLPIELDGNKVDKAYVNDLIEILGIGEKLQNLPGQLSGGQQQRVAIARALVIEPSMLLLDEPMSNLDVALRVRMREEIRAIQKKIGITTLFITHDQQEALAISDKIAVMRDGEVLQVGEPEEIYNRPNQEFVANFVGVSNKIVRGDYEFFGIVGEVDRPYIFVRPEEFSISGDGKCGISGCITEVKFGGMYYDYTIQDGKSGLSRGADE